MEQALITRAAEAEAEVALFQDEWAVYKSIEGLEEFPGFVAVFLDNFIGETRETPDVPAEFFPDVVGDFFTSFGLDEGFAAAEGEAGLAFEMGQLFQNIFNRDEHAGAVVPSFGVLATGAMVGAALCPEDGAKTVTVDDVVVL